jgi:hypothetical protein
MLYSTMSQQDRSNIPFSSIPIISTFQEPPIKPLEKSLPVKRKQGRPAK